MQQNEILAHAATILRESHALLNQFKQEGWAPLGSGVNTKNKEAIKQARKAGKMSPLIIAGIRAYKLLVHGQKRSIKAIDEDVNILVQRILTDNKNACFSQRKRMEKEESLWTDANLYIRFFVNPETGSIAIRFIEPLEIEQHITDPEDKDTIWLYERHYERVVNGGKQQAVIVYYPNYDFTLSDAQKVSLEQRLIREAGSSRIEFDWATLIYHIELNGGLPECYAALNWAKCYEHLLQMIATVYGAISAISLVVKAKAEKVRVTSQQLQQNREAEQRYGNAAVMDLEGDVKTLNARSALMPSADLDVYLEIVAMVFGLAPHLFGKPEAGGGLGSDQHRYEAMNLAVEARQSLWQEIESTILNFALLQLVKAGKLTKARIETLYFRNREGELIGWQERLEWNDGIDGSIDIIYPPIRKRDVATTIDALIRAATLDGKKPTDLISPRTFYQILSEVLPLGDVDTRIANLPEFWTDDNSLVAEGPQRALAVLEQLTESLRNSLREE